MIKIKTEFQDFKINFSCPYVYLKYMFGENLVQVSSVV